MEALDVKDAGSDYIANIDFIPPSPPRDPTDLPDYLYDNPSFHHLNQEGTHSLNATQNNPHTPSYNGSYFNSPYSQHSELSFSGEDINFDLLSEIAGMDSNTYEPSEYDGPSGANNNALNNPSNSLLMYTQDSDYMSPHFSPDAVGGGGNNSRRGSPFDHSSPSSTGDPNDMVATGGGGSSSAPLMGAFAQPNMTDAGAGRHSRASSVTSNHRSPVPSPSPQPQHASLGGAGGNTGGSPFQPHASPRLDVAQSFGAMSVHTPNWGPQALPTHSPNLRGHSVSPLPPHAHAHPQQTKAMSPPRLLMPDNGFDGSSSVLGLDIQHQQHQQHQGQQDNHTLLAGVPKINAPEGSNSANGDDDMNGGGSGGQGGPSFHIVPATPIGGAGDGHQNSFQTMSTITQGAELNPSDLAQQHQQQQLGVRSQPPSRQPSPYTPPSRLSPAPPQHSQHPQQQNAPSTSNNTGGFVFPDITQMMQPTAPSQQQDDQAARSRRNSNTNQPPDWARFDYQQQQQIVQQQQQAAQAAQAQAQAQQQQQRIHQAQLQSFTFGGPSSASNNNANASGSGSNNFLSPELGASGMRRSISESMGARGGHRLSRSEDIRLPGVGGFGPNNNIAAGAANNANALGGGGVGGAGLGPGGYQPHHGQSSSLSVGGGAPFPDYSQQQGQGQGQGGQQNSQFLHPLSFPSHSHSHSASASVGGSPLPVRRSLSPGLPGLPYPGPPSGVNVGHFRRASSGTRSDRGAEVWGSQGVGGGMHGHGHAHQLSVAQRRVSPYPSPNASPRVRYEELQDDGIGNVNVNVGLGMQGGMVQEDGLLGVGVPGMGGQGMGGGQGGLGGLGLGLPGLGGPGLSLGPGTIAGGAGGGAGQAMGLGHPGLGEIGEPPVSGGFSEEIPITGRGTYANHPSLVNDGASSNGGRRRAGSANSADNPNSLGAPVAKQNVTTGRTANASIRRRKQDANFACTVPGCNSTFTRGFNLKGHLRSHYEQKPYKCHWPGCGKGFARQHDCKRHEQLHSNFRPFECEGCKKQFARMDALNRHLRSEAGGECLRIVAERGGNPANMVSGGPGSVGGSVSPGPEGGDVGMDDGMYGGGEEMKPEVVVTTRSGRQVPRRRMTGAMDEDAWSGVAL